MSDNSERPDSENESGGDQTGPERRHGDRHGNSGPDPAHRSHSSKDKNSGGEYPSSAGADESPQEPVTEEKSAAPRPETTSGTSARNNDEPANSPYSGGDSAGAAETGQDKTMDDYPSTGASGNNEDEAGQNNDSGKRDTT